MNKRTDTNKTDYLALAIFFPAVVALAIVPIIMKVTLYINDRFETNMLFGGTFDPEANSYMFTDVNTIGKSSAICILAVIMLALALMCCWFMFRHAEKRMLVYTGASVVFVALSLMSALGSEFKDIAFEGAFGRMEGFFTVASYFVMFLFTMYAFRKTQNFRYVIIALMICTGVNFIIGIFQYTGNNLLLSDWFRAFVVDGDYKDIVQLDVDAASEKGKMYGALYHYNYVGSFMGMIIPLFTVLAAWGEKLWHKLVFAAFAALSLFMLFASTARSGLVAIGAAAVVGIILFARVLIRRWKITVSVVAGAAVLLVGANFALDNALFRRIPSLFTDIVEFVAPAENVDLYDTLPVREIAHNTDGSVTFVTQTNEINIAFDAENKQYSFTDKNGDDLELVYTDYTLISIADEGFERVNFEFASTDNNPYYDNAFFMWFDGDDDMPLVFMLFNEKQIHMIHPDLGVRITPENADAIGFRGKELLGSSRGYIWSRTIPLLKECMVTGYGPDTFAYIFPQNDYLAKYYAYQEGFYIAVDKPHNLYLQIFFNNGLIALIAFLAICVFYLVDCFRLYALKKKYRIEQIYGISIMLAVVGYLAAGMFNDSVVAVAPVFWILLGVGAALNTINRRMDKNIAVDHDGVVVKDNTANKQKSKKQIKADEELNNRAEQLAKSLAEKRSPSTAVADISNGSEKVAPEELQRLGGTLNSDQQMMEMIEKSAKRGGGGVLTQEQRQELSKIIMQLRDEREASERKEKDNDND